jgi:molybdopterin-guanine dinucleotide biosynthesis protein A
MGRDKALVQLAGRTLAANAVEQLLTAGLSASIVRARSELDAVAPVIADHAPDEGPLGGICSALAYTNAELAIFISVDQPLLPASLLVYLIRDAGITGAAVTLTSINGFAQTFPVALRTSLLPLLQRELEAGRSGCFASFQAAARAVNEAIREIPAEMLAQAGQVLDHNAVPVYRWFLNVNTPSDVERAARLRVS